MTCTALRRTVSTALAGLLLLAGCASSSTPPVQHGAAESGPLQDVAAPTPDPLPQSTSAATRSAAEDAAATFLADQRSANAEQLVEAIAADGDARWVPWLIDLMRLNASNRLSVRIGEVLEQMTGVPSTSRIPNLIAHGSWAQSRQLTGGTGYEDFKTALYQRVDPEFGALIASVEDPVELAAIQWGGVPRGGIPELNDPPRSTAADADWMTSDEVVIGVVSNGAAVAYPLRFLARHELANDTVGGDPLAIVYCTLCRSALVFERIVNGQRLDFETSGLLLNSNKIMVDAQTDTLWHHLRGRGIGGPLTGRTLTLRSNVLMTWADWVAEHPQTEVLQTPEPIFFDDPERPPIAYDYTPGEAYASYYDNADVWFPILDTPDEFELKHEVLGIVNGDDALAISVEQLNLDDSPLTVTVGGSVFVIEPTGAGARVVDSTSTRAVVEQSFWFAWYANHPGTRTCSDPRGAGC